MSLLFVIFVIILITLILWFIFWSDLILYSDPINVPVEFYTNWTTNVVPKEPIPTKEKYLVIGAGFVGLGVCASLKRHGIHFDCVDGNDAIGGNWYNGVFDCTHIISSKKTTEYKDFPMPTSYPDFPSAAQMLKYLNSYADHWGIRQQIQLNTVVLNCQKMDQDYWEIEVKKNEKIEKIVYRGVLICNGHHRDKRIPKYPGEFTGEIMHSKDFRSAEILKGKRVLIVGGGNSACDVAVEAGKFARKAHISQRRGYWIMPKLLFGIPMVEMISPWMPIWFQRILLRILFRVMVGTHEKYGFDYPDHKIFEHHPTINNELLHDIRLGKIMTHGDIKELKGKNVFFKDGTQEEIDLIIFCTGYNTSIPMLKDYIQFENGSPVLLGGSFMPGIKNAYYVGLGQPRYGAGPLISIGADVLSKVILLQKHVDQPIGTILQNFGMKPAKKSEVCADIILDPHATFKELIIFRLILLSWLKWLKIKLE
jgi:hypothetical protein